MNVDYDVIRKMMNMRVLITIWKGCFDIVLID